MTPHNPWYVQGDPWTLTETSFQPDRNLYFETIFAQANGYMGVRGYHATAQQHADTVREGYLAGVFSEVDEEPTRIIGQFPWPVVQMVSIPELFACRIELDGEALDLESGELIDYQRSLDLRSAVLETRLNWRSPAGRTTRLTLQRFLSAANPHLACQRITLTPDGWSGPVRIAATINGDTPSYFRCGDRSRAHLPQRHFHGHDVRTAEGTGVVSMMTAHTAHRLAVAARFTAEAPIAVEAGGATAFTQRIEAELTDGATFDACRFMAVACSRDHDFTGDPADAAERMVRSAGEAGFEHAAEANRQTWRDRWQHADVEIEGPPRDQKVVRYNVFQLLQMAPFHSDRVNIPARGYAYNRYRGLYFWDTEIFMLPFYTWSFPEVARNLLSFRHHTLDGARHNAWHWGGGGALFPWMTDSDTGLDNSIDARVWKLFHQTADIAYAFDQYAGAAADQPFMLEQGLEVLLETARFFGSRFVRHEGRAWHLERTIGPDEDHAPGLDNGFTNLMARRNLQLALGWLDRLKASEPDRVEALRAKLGLSDSEIARWRDMAEHIHIPVVPGTDVPLQDEHLMNKKPADVLGWRLREAPEQWRLPEGAKRGDYQVIKQADIVLAMWLLMDQFTPEQVAAAYDFYEPMTLHISSLSWNTHALVAARLGRREQAYDYYLKSAGLDLDDVKDATEDGLHAAALGGCWQAVVLGFAGLSHRDGQPVCDPQLPEPWEAVRFTITCAGETYRIEARRDGTWDATPSG